MRTKEQEEVRQRYMNRLKNSVPRSLQMGFALTLVVEELSTILSEMDARLPKSLNLDTAELTSEEKAMLES